MPNTSAATRRSTDWVHVILILVIVAVLIGSAMGFFDLLIGVTEP